MGGMSAHRCIDIGGWLFCRCIVDSKRLDYIDTDYIGDRFISVFQVFFFPLRSHYPFLNVSFIKFYMQVAVFKVELAY